MRRFHQLSPDDWEKWRRARDEHGRRKYGSAHLDRYNVVDIAEELLDAHTITDRLMDRVARQGEEAAVRVAFLVASFRACVDACMRLLREIDRILPDEVCTDGQGGQRIWWGGAPVAGADREADGIG